MDDISVLYKKHLILLYKELQEYANEHSELSSINLIDNPHTERLVQAFSLLHANLHFTLEESFSQFLTDLFNLLYPHYNVPIPSLTMLVFEPDKKKEEMLNLGKGLLLEMQSDSAVNNFQLCYSSQIMPAEVRGAECDITNNLVDIRENRSTISIGLSTVGKVVFNKLGLDKIRFCIKGLSDIKYLIYKNIFNNLIKFSVCSGSKIIFLDKSKIKKVGFSDQENLLPFTDSSFAGYRMLTEFFTFPDKFLFFDIDLNSVDLNEFTSFLEIRLYLNTDELNGLITSDNFILNAIPAINLFAQETDPVAIESESFKYPILSNKSNQEIYSINRVMVNLGDNNEEEAIPLLKYDNDQDNAICYITKRKNIFENGVYKETIVNLSLGMNSMIFNDKAMKYFYVNAICFNGNLPYTLFIDSEKNFTLIDNTIPISTIKCITKPTPVYNLCKSEDQKWNMIAHFSPHYMNLLGTMSGKNIFKEILSLYCCDNIKTHKDIIDSIIDITVREKVLRVQTERYNQFCKGNYIEIVFNNSKLSEGLLYLFLNVVEYFLGMYCSINSFIQLSGKFSNNGKVVYEGLPRNGMKCLI